MMMDYVVVDADYHIFDYGYDSLLVIYYTFTGPPPKEWCQILATPEGMVPNSGPPRRNGAANFGPPPMEWCQILSLKLT